MKTAKIVSTCAILVACLGLTACGKQTPRHAVEVGDIACESFGGLLAVKAAGPFFFGPEVDYGTYTCKDAVKIEIQYKRKDNATYICSAKNPC